jgi:hypothetical protein
VMETTMVDPTIPTMKSTTRTRMKIVKNVTIDIGWSAICKHGVMPV